MSNGTNDNPNPELIAALTRQLQQLQAPGTQNPATASGWQTLKPDTGAMGVQGVAVPVSVQTPIGKVRVYFWLGPEAARNPESLLAAIERMVLAGIPVDAWEGKGGNGGGWGGKSGGWNNGKRGRW